MIRSNIIVLKATICVSKTPDFVNLAISTKFITAAWCPGHELLRTYHLVVLIYYRYVSTDAS